ncbi:GDSL-type esterase/lipase family protein [Desmospora activa]|uniref:Lysophospholipase L1-like esterase n=1 Tax=Desmospora activa DSM 45169 TaxID=1121389 RepID=A0A2T4Z8U3_9BACL|nr:GDSL-type esterase/lipase family protein [Desmospora activa]PTM58309.1 lysophospholipase L1-like esterase [Desmospora activa DSM 45169]
MKMKSRPLWIAINLLSLASLLLFAAGFSWAVAEIMGNTSAPQPNEARETDVSSAAPEGEHLLLSFGDSLTRGTGDTTGQGYFGRIRSALREQDETVSAVNLGIKGQTSPELREQMKQPRVRQLLGEASWVTLTIGGNDLFRGSGSLESIDLDEAALTREEYANNLKAIVEAIRQENADVPIFIFGLYNPFGDLGDRKTTDALVREWNQTIVETTADDPLVVIIPLFDLFQLNPDRYLYSDKFHPNNDGYQFMADRLLQTLTALEENEVNVDAP